MSKIYFQGTYGAYSHLASLSIDPKAEIIPCKTSMVVKNYCQNIYQKKFLTEKK